MSEPRLAELLQEVVADVPRPHLVEPALAGAARRRRRTRAGVVVAAAAAVAVVVSGLAVAGREAADAPPLAPTSSPSRPAAAGRISTYAGVPVFRAPAPDQVADLPARTPGTPIPATVDLAQAAPDVAAEPVDRVLAAFAVQPDERPTDRVLLLAEDGTLRSLDVSRLDRVTKPDGYRLDPATISMVSASGRYLVFPQDGALELYTLATGTWRRLPVDEAPTYAVTWSDDDRLLLPDPRRPNRAARRLDVTGGERTWVFARTTGPGVPLRGSTPYGRAREGRDGLAQSYGQGAPIQGADDGFAPGNHEFLAVSQVRQPVIALFGATGDDGRWKQCCPVVGWLDATHVAYEIRSAAPVVVAWEVGTTRFQRVARIVGLDGAAYVSSWAALRSWKP